MTQSSVIFIYYVVLCYISPYHSFLFKSIGARNSKLVRNFENIVIFPLSKYQSAVKSEDSVISVGLSSTSKSGPGEWSDWDNAAHDDDSAYEDSDDTIPLTLSSGVLGSMSNMTLLSSGMQQKKPVEIDKWAGWSEEPPYFDEYFQDDDEVIDENAIRNGSINPNQLFKTFENVYIPAIPISKPESSKTNVTTPIIVPVNSVSAVDLSNSVNPGIKDVLLRLDLLILLQLVLVVELYVLNQ